MKKQDISAFDKVAKLKPRVMYFGRVWHWHFRHCWWGNLKKPVQLDWNWPYQISVTVLGFTWMIVPR